MAKISHTLRRALLGLVLWLWAAAVPAACGSECWVDLSSAAAGSGAADGSSASNLCAGLADTDCTIEAGTTTTVNLCNARTSALTLATGGQSSLWVRFQFSPTGCTPASVTVASGSAVTLSATLQYAILDGLAPLSSSGAAVFINGADHVVFEDAAILNDGATSGAVTCSASAASVDITFRNSVISGSAANGVHCLPTGASLTYSDWTFEDSSVTGNAGHGVRMTMESTGWSTSKFDRIAFQRMTITGNGTGASGGSGIFVRNCNSAIASDTCATDGNRGTWFQVVDSTISDNGKLGASASGGINVQGFDTWEISRNVIERNYVSGGQISLLKMINGESRANDLRQARSANGIDGVGVFVDRYTADSDFTGNVVDGCGTEDDVYNEGSGFALFRAERNNITGNLIANCRGGLQYGGTITDGNVFANNAVVDCVDSASFDGYGIAEYRADTTAPAGEVSLTPASQVAARNNVIVNCKRGAVVDTDLAGYETNDLYLVESPYDGQSTGIETDLAVDPKWVGGLNPSSRSGVILSAISPLLISGTLQESARDVFGDVFAAPGTIGPARRDQCYRRGPSGALDMARRIQLVQERCRGIPPRYPEGL